MSLDQNLFEQVKERERTKSKCNQLIKVALNISEAKEKDIRFMDFLVTKV